VSEFQTLKKLLAARPEGESWQLTYSALRKICKAQPELMPTMEVLLDIKAVIIWATVCCERGFSKMKLAKSELQAAMETVILDARLRIQMLGPSDPRKLPTAEKNAMGAVAFKARVAQYNDAIDALVNEAIQLWDPVKHNSQQSVRNADKGAKKLGKEHKKPEQRSDPNAPLIHAERVGTVEQNTTHEDAIPDKPAWTPLTDGHGAMAMIDVSKCDPASLVNCQLGQLFRIDNEYGGFLHWEWYTAMIKKATRRTRDQHLLVEARFPGEKGNTTVDLSEGKAYLTDWVLIEEKKDGGMVRKKKQAAATAAQSAATGGASSSGASAPSVAVKAPTPAPGTGRRKSKATATATPPSPDRAEPARKRRN